MPVNLEDFTFKQYAAKEQAELKVRIDVPGSWFNGLEGAERSATYEAQAYDYEEAHVFKKNRGTETLPAIKFLCEADVFEDPKHAGFLMRLTEWNRYRNDTYKNNRAAELPYISAPAGTSEPSTRRQRSQGGRASTPSTTL